MPLYQWASVIAAIHDPWVQLAVVLTLIVLKEIVPRLRR